MEKSVRKAFITLNILLLLSVQVSAAPLKDFWRDDPVCHTNDVNVGRFSSANCTPNVDSGCIEPVWNSNVQLTIWDILAWTSGMCVGAYKITADGFANGYQIVKSQLFSLRNLLESLSWEVCHNAFTYLLLLCDFLYVVYIFGLFSCALHSAALELFKKPKREVELKQETTAAPVKVWKPKPKKEQMPKKKRKKPPKRKYKNKSRK